MANQAVKRRCVWIHFTGQTLQLWLENQAAEDEIKAFLEGATTSALENKATRISFAGRVFFVTPWNFVAYYFGEDDPELKSPQERLANLMESQADPDKDAPWREQ